MDFKPILEAAEKLRLTLSPLIRDYKIKPTIKDGAPVIFIEVPPQYIPRIETVLPHKVDGIKIIIVSSLL
ncbi:MAG: hypothetical protein EB120_10930 [Proteobacteria bacterium]|nr:hypothetical protein [Pseudomonadota bacterium]